MLMELDLGNKKNTKSEQKNEHKNCNLSISVNDYKILTIISSLNSSPEASSDTSPHFHVQLLSNNVVEKWSC